MKHFTIIFYCLALGVMQLIPICAQEHDILQENAIPASDDHGTIRYGILLPPSYEDNSLSFPVIYYLHGGNQYYLAPRAQWIASFFNRQYIDGKLPECIMIFIDGGEGWWMDHYDGSPLLETEIVNYLIPHIDQNFRTIRSNRLVMGYSMGGNGAIFLYAKHPELFTAAASLDGGIVTYEGYLNRTGGRSEIVNNKEYFLEYGSPYGWVKPNQKDLRAKQDTSILLTAGYIIDANRDFLSVLNDLKIPARFIEFGYDHEFGYVFSESQDMLLRFIEEHLGQAQ